MPAPTRLLSVVGFAAALLTAGGPQVALAASTSVAPGVTFRALSQDGSRVFVGAVALGAASTPVPVLAGDRLAGFETTSSMARRSGAALAVNGDFGLASGRPVHAFAADGALAQTAQVPGRGLGLGRAGGSAVMGFPDVGVEVPPGPGEAALPVPLWNSGAPEGDVVAGFTAAGAGLEVAPAGSCYSRLVRRGAPFVAVDGSVKTRLEVKATRCTGPPPAPGRGVVLAGRPGTGAETSLRRLVPGRVVTLSQSQGFPRAWGLLGASESLVESGQVNAADVDGPGDYVQSAQPRTAAGRTADNRLLLVVVDGRQPGYSTGMSLRQLAELLVGLGAREAVNLDGGGSSTMWVRGRVVNRPSGGSERQVCSALAVLPGAAGVRPAQPATAAGVPTRDTWQRAAADAGSTGGLADAIERRGGRLDGDLAEAAALLGDGPAPAG